MSGEVYGGTGGGACPSCGGFPPNCSCYAQAEARAEAMAEVYVLEQTRQDLSIQILAIDQKLNSFKVKCATCRCRVFPWEKCRCCAEPRCMEDEPLI